MLETIKTDIIAKKAKYNKMLGLLVEYYLKYKKFYKQKKPTIQLNYNVFIRDFMKEKISRKEKMKILYYLKKFQDLGFIKFWSIIYIDKEKKFQRKVFYRIEIL